MRKLTSKDIDWIDGMNCAVVFNGLCGPVSVQCPSGDSETELGKGAYLVTREPTRNQAIVDAVNALNGELTIENCYLNMNGNDKMLNKNRRGNYITTVVKVNDDIFTCTIAEFNQYVKEMSEAAWLDGKKHDYSEYKAAFEFSEKAKEIEWKNGDECCVISSCDYSIAQEFEKYLGENCTIKSVFKNDIGVDIAAVGYKNGCCICWRIDMLSKPETEEQKVERENAEKAKELLISASRQYKHNNGDGFVGGYDCEEVVNIVANLLKQKVTTNE